ncbi:IS701 family transposase [Amycolatopsis anabasis]|uniref:IS701 family transposase n=1 Tax=Amycolatopsis anabasis TaxID=1840409 RepID=UPI00131B874D
MGHAEAAGRDPLSEFAADVFTPLRRADQRAKAELYLRGLLLDGGRKSMSSMAQRLAVDHQVLQQFVTSSTWDTGAVRARLARRAAARTRTVAWVIGDLGFPKDGAGSPCVTRQFDRTHGKIANCQAAVSVRLVGDGVSAAVNWRLFVPEDWDDTTATDPGEVAEIARRRRRCGIPATERHRPRWAMAVEMLDDLLAWGLRPAIVVVGRAYGDVAEFRDALRRRRLPCLMRVGGVPFTRPFELGRRMETGYREMREEFGLDHFEGRSWIGWNRHVTLVSAAQLFRNSVDRLSSGEKCERKTA